MRVFASLDKEQKVAAIGLACLALIAIFAIGRNYLQNDATVTLTPLSEGETRVELPDPHSIALNHATAEELQTIPGIGPEISARIVAERARTGGYKSVDDIRWVKGIGPDRAREFGQYLRL